jgi:integrator complex subunit 4
MHHLGQNHPALVTSLVAELLSTHPYFEAIEPDVDDPSCIL